jgi:uncharacterized membrane protein HdeD (DUF308 family)
MKYVWKVLAALLLTAGTYCIYLSAETLELPYFLLGIAFYISGVIIATEE